MRIAFAAIPLLLLGACQVSKEGNSTTVSFNQDVAENAAADFGNVAENIGGDIANDVEKTADKVQNKVGDVNVKVETNGSSGATNKADGNSH